MVGSLGYGRFYWIYYRVHNNQNIEKYIIIGI